MPALHPRRTSISLPSHRHFWTTSVRWAFVSLASPPFHHRSIPCIQAQASNPIPVVAPCSSLFARIQLYQQHLPSYCVTSGLHSIPSAHQFCSLHPSRPSRPLHPRLSFVTHRIPITFIRSIVLRVCARILVNVIHTAHGYLRFAHALPTRCTQEFLIRVACRYPMV